MEPPTTNDERATDAHGERQETVHGGSGTSLLLILFCGWALAMGWLLLEAIAFLQLW